MAIPLVFVKVRKLEIISPIICTLQDFRQLVQKLKSIKSTISTLQDKQNEWIFVNLLKS